MTTVSRAMRNPIREGSKSDTESDVVGIALQRLRPKFIFVTARAGGAGAAKIPVSRPAALCQLETVLFPVETRCCRSPAISAF
jgi:hypothetical protein